MLQVLNETAGALIAEVELPQLLETILDRVQSMFKVDRCAILRIAPGGRRLLMLKSVGYDPSVAENFSVAVGEGISGWVASTGMPAFVEDLASDHRYIPGVQGAVSEVAVPLRRKEEVIGVLDIESTRPLALGDIDMKLLSLFASHAAAAIYNASLIAEVTESRSLLERRVRELQVLNHVGKLLGEVIALDDVLAEILRLAHEVLHFDSCAVLLPDPANPELLRVRAAIGYRDDVIDEFSVKRGGGVTGGVYQSGIPRLIEDVSQEPGYVSGTVGGRCEMACPLIARGKVLGVIDAEGKDAGAFTEQEFVLFSTFASQAAVAIRNAQTMARKQAVYYQTISSLASALEARDSYTRGHSERVTRLGLEIGEKLGLREGDKALIRQAGLLHDIGKIGIPDQVLNKRDTLSTKERSEIEHHPLFGNTILQQLHFLTDASKAILHHHERFDGTGYPSGLFGHEIPVVARIIAVADSWDAMTSDRPYRDAMEEEQALDEVLSNSGRQFDPEVVRAFLAVIGREDLLVND